MEKRNLKINDKVRVKIKLSNGEQYDIATEKGGSVNFSIFFTRELYDEGDKMQDSDIDNSSFDNPNQLDLFTSSK